MKQFLIGLGALIVVVVAAALIAPTFIDWNRYRARIASEASDALGRTVEIRGDIGLSLLPAPVVFINDAHLANIEGASDADMVSLTSLEVRIALAPLLAGTVRIESVKLVRPVINLEIMDGGHSNMTFERRIADPRTSGLQPKIPLTTGAKVAASDNGGLNVSLDNFVVERGTLIFRNSVTGYVERVDDINGRLSFASLKGPMNAVASAVVRGVPISLEAGASAIIQGRTMPFNLDLTVGPGNVKAQFSGSLNGMDESPRLKGKLTLDGQNFAEFVRALGAAPLPEALARPFGAVGLLALGADGGDIADLAIRLDNSQAHGRAAIAIADSIDAEATLAVSRLDIDALLAPLLPPPPSAAKKDVAAKKAGASLELPSKSSPPPQAGGGFSLEALPSNMTANLNLSVEALIWRRDVVRQARLNVSLANREITVNQFSALLPGSTDIALFGFVTEKERALQFDGTVDATTNDLRGLAQWLGGSTDGIASERLRRLGLTAKVSARPDVVAVSELHAKLDSTQIDGAATVALRDRLSVGANISVDRINLDAYMPIGGGLASVEPSASSPPAGSPSAAPASPASANPLAALSVLGDFDANVRARVGALTMNALPLNNVRVEATLVDGVLDAKSVTISDLVGVTASMSGAFTGLKTAAGGVSDPRLKDVVIEAKAKSLSALFRVADIKSPVTPEALGATTAKVRLNGNARALDLGVELQTMGGRAALDGKLQTSGIIPRFDGRASVSHPDFARLVRAFGVDYRPRAAQGGVDIAGKLAGTVIESSLSEVSGTIAGVRLQGAATVNILGRKPRIKAQLVTGDLDIDAFMPPKRTAAHDVRPRIVPAAFVVPGPVPVAPSLVPAAAPWTNDPIDVAALSLVDASVEMKSDSLKFGGTAVNNADIDAEIKDGGMKLRRFTGKLYGGDVTLDGTMVPQGRGIRLDARYALGGADVGAAERAFGGKGLAKGSLTTEGRLAGTGASSAAIVASLSGEGAVAVRGVDINQGAGGALATLGGIAGSLNTLAAATGGRQQAGLLGLSGPYRVTNGIVTFDELALTSGVGDGALKGKVDLPQWRIAASGEVRLAKTLLTELLVRDKGTAQPIPVEIEGALDAPRVRIDIAKLPGGGVRVPALDRLRQKKGVGEVLDRILPPAQKSEPVQAKPAPAPAPAPQPAPQQPPPSRTDRAQDILRDILRGVGR